MPYASVYYPKSDRLYTFFTTNRELTKMQKILVKDRNGFSLCDFAGYVKKPPFPCQVIVASQLQLEELAEEVRVEMDLEEEQETIPVTKEESNEPS